MALMRSISWDRSGAGAGACTGSGAGAGEADPAAEGDHRPAGRRPCAGQREHPVGALDAGAVFLYRI